MTDKIMRRKLFLQQVAKVFGKMQNDLCNDLHKYLHGIKPGIYGENLLTRSDLRSQDLVTK